MVVIKAFSSSCNIHVKATGNPIFTFIPTSSALMMTCPSSPCLNGPTSTPLVGMKSDPSPGLGISRLLKGPFIIDVVVILDLNLNIGDSAILPIGKKLDGRSLGMIISIDDLLY